MTIIRRTVVGASTPGLTASLLTGAFAQGAETAEAERFDAGGGATGCAGDQEGNRGPQMRLPGY